MIRKGKLCFFKVILEILKIYLINILLYIMVVDSFEKVLKLVGNSILLMDDIMN